jgi:hypothetical protein
VLEQRLLCAIQRAVAAYFWIPHPLAFIAPADPSGVIISCK